jgi:hypothetical protein
MEDPRGACQLAKSPPIQLADIAESCSFDRQNRINARSLVPGDSRRLALRCRFDPLPLEDSSDIRHQSMTRGTDFASREGGRGRRLAECDGRDVRAPMSLREGLGVLRGGKKTLPGDWALTCLTIHRQAMKTLPPPPSILHAGASPVNKNTAADIF